MKKCVVSWSGGKDSCYALMLAQKNGYSPVALLNVLNEEGKISRSHGIPKAILKAQANAIGLPLYPISSSWDQYQQKFIAALGYLKDNYAASHVLFGDIDLEEHKEWEEMVCTKAGLTAVLPLWQKERKALVLEMLKAGIETIIVSCNEAMGKEFLGRKLSIELVEELESMNIDPCGEKGEFHTLVINAPFFSESLNVRIENKVQHQNYWFSELKLINV